MLKHFRSRFSAEVEQLCLLAKLWFSTLIILKWIILNDNLIDYFYYSYSYYYYLYIYLFIIILIIILIFILCISVYFLLTYFTILPTFILFFF